MKKITKNVNSRLRNILFALILALFVMMSSVIVSDAEDGIDAEVEGRCDEVIDDFREALPEGVGEVDTLDGISDRLGVKRILADAMDILKDSSGELISLLLSLVGIAVMSALASLSEKELSPHITGAVGVVGAALLFDRLWFLVDGVRSSLCEINEFFGAVIPITLTVNSLGASPTAASVQATGMGLTLGAYSFISERMLGGMVAAIFVTSALSAVDPMLARLSRSVKNVFLTLLGTLTVLIGATFTLQSTISVSADSVALRSAKYAVSNAIPIVGGTVSGAFSLVAGGVQYARGIVGGGAISVLVSLLIAPLITLLAYRFCLKLGVGFCSWCSLGGCESVLGSLLGALDTLIAVYSLTSVIYITELVSFLKGGVSVG